MENFLRFARVCAHLCALSCTLMTILAPRGRAPFGQHQESGPLTKSNTGISRFTGFPSLCAYSESSLTNLIGSGLNLLCLQSHSKTECRWTRPEVAILGADQKERGLWGREDAKIARSRDAHSLLRRHSLGSSRNHPRMRRAQCKY